MNRRDQFYMPVLPVSQVRMSVNLSSRIGIYSPFRARPGFTHTKYGELAAAACCAVASTAAAGRRRRGPCCLLVPGGTPSWAAAPPAALSPLSMLSSRRARRRLAAVANGVGAALSAGSELAAIDAELQAAQSEARALQKRIAQLSSKKDLMHSFWTSSVALLHLCKRWKMP